MTRTGASAVAIEAVVGAARSDIHASVDETPRAAPPAARDFVRATFRVIRSGSPAAQAAAFTFGREDAIPDMFRALVKDLDRETQGDLNQLVWYLQRHIEIDGDDHGPLSLRMAAELCGTDLRAWEQASEAAEDAIQARLALWDGILLQIQSMQQSQIWRNDCVDVQRVNRRLGLAYVGGSELALHPMRRGVPVGPAVRQRARVFT